MTNAAPEKSASAATNDPDAPLPRLWVPIRPEQLPERLETAARRGMIPGLEANPTASRLVVTDFGAPFESRLFGSVSESGAGSEIRFHTKLKTKGVWIFAIVLVLTVWPGVWLTDSMLITYFPSYSIPTWWWYLPLTVPFVPLSLRTALRKSRRSAHSEAISLIEKLESALGGAIGKGSGV